MIIGYVDTRHEIVIPLTIRSGLGQEEVIDVILDTGFTGTLTLPPSTIARLGLRWRSQVWSVLANGTTELSDVYACTVIWDGVARPIRVQVLDSVPLLGMKLLIGYDLRVRVVDGGVVEIDIVP